MEVKEEQMTQVEGAAAGKPGKEKKPLNVKKEILSWILTIAVAVAVALLIRTFLFEPIRVDGESMCDTLQDGEIMLVTKPNTSLATRSAEMWSSASIRAARRISSSA